jgi:hypothetical protein
MATLAELAESYAARIRVASNKQSAIEGIAREIHSITYAGTDERLDQAAKIRLVSDVSSAISKQIQAARRATGDVEIIKEAENKRYLELAQALMELVRQGK